MLSLDNEIQFVKGVGPRIAAILGAKGITTVEDLLYYLPFRYEDRVNPRSIAELRAGEMASVIGEVRSSGLFRTRKMPIFELNVGEPAFKQMLTQVSGKPAAEAANLRAQAAAAEE